MRARQGKRVQPKTLQHLQTGGRVDAAMIAACLKEIQDPAKLIEARAWVKSKAGRV